MKKLIYIFLFSITFIHAQNLITSEQFAACSLPGNWTLKTETGNYGFSILKSNLLPQSDATCSILYQQANRTDNNSKKFTITTREFDLFNYTSYNFNFGLRYVKTSAVGNLKLYSVIDNASTLLQTYSKDVVQNGIVLVPQSFILNTLNSNRKIKFIFEYEASGIDFNSIVLIDNLFLAGPDNDDCSRAIELFLDQACLPGNSEGAVSTGPQILCTGTFTQGIWYKFNSNFTGNLKLQTKAVYNDAISVFEGSCASLKDLICINKDEYGFGGERNFISVESGKIYYFRISKQTGFYGREDISNLCISIQKLDPVTPNHDLCNNKKILTINSSCIKEDNIAADFSNPVPSLNEKSRADVWYSFKPTSTKSLEIISNADFADVLTLFKGSCSQLTEVKCEDLGGKLLLENPIINTEYFIQVSGYFSTVEGHLCLEVKEKTTDKPTNEDCPTAKAISLNQACQTISTVNGLKSTVKPSCVVYNAPDVWFSFVAPSSKKIVMDIQAGFLFNWAIDSGRCNSLKEVICGRSQDPCLGGIQVDGLIPGRTYYLQILAAVNPLKPTEGSLCVRIDDGSTSNPFNPLKLTLQQDCLHGVLGKISYVASGGKGQYTYEGPSATDIFYPGSTIEAFIQDESGCRSFDKITIDCQSPPKCKNSTLDIQLNTECIVDNIGRQTGEVILHFNGTGGSGAYFAYGTQDGSKLKHGDDYQIILIDTDSCYVIEEGRINCPPFDCSQSKLSLIPTYECVDTLLKAVLRLEVKGNLGTYTITGNQNGDQLSKGETYRIEIKDEAGCSVESTGQIICNFDSCAYARPSLQVSYDCILDINGNRVGKAVLNVSSSSYAGSIQISGNKDGDTLNHLDIYNVLMTDGFGCSLNQTGEINCLPVSGKDINDSRFTHFYPNPANEYLNIFVPQCKESKIQYTVTNNVGEIIENNFAFFTTTDKAIHINLEKFPSGMLYIKMEGSHFFDIIRFIKI